MTVEIENMRPGPSAGTVAIFDAYVDGWFVRDCVIVKREDGTLTPLPPALREGKRAVQLPDALWRKFIRKARAAYREMKAEPSASTRYERPDAGLMRVVRADIEEEMQRAGL